MTTATGPVRLWSRSRPIAASSCCLPSTAVATGPATLEDTDEGIVHYGPDSFQSRQGMPQLLANPPIGTGQWTTGKAAARSPNSHSAGLPPMALRVDVLRCIHRKLGFRPAPNPSPSALPGQLSTDQPHEPHGGFGERPAETGQEQS
jgi:hypothetical protein